MPDLPSGTVTFLFTDVEGSTEHLQRDPETYAEALDAHRLILRSAAGQAGGIEIDCRGEEFLFAFPRARDGVGAALAGQAALAGHAWPQGVPLRVRMGIHTGEPDLRDDGYLGLDVHRGARICAAAYGGQVLVSQSTYELVTVVEPAGITLRDLGEHRLKDILGSERLFEVAVEGAFVRFPPLRSQGAESAFVGREPELAQLVRAAVRGSERIRDRLQHLGKREPGLAELGWRARALLPKVPEPSRQNLAAFGGDLFGAARTVADVDRYLDRIDRKGLVRRLKEYREMGVLSKRAAREADSYELQLEDIERLFATRATVSALARDAEAALAMPGKVDELRGRVQALSERLDRELAQARNDLGATSAKLKRTRARGIYRLGARYVVPYFDDLGVELRREFEAMADAQEFRRVVQLHRKRHVQQDALEGSTYRGHESTSGPGPL